MYIRGPGHDASDPCRPKWGRSSSCAASEHTSARLRSQSPGWPPLVSKLALVRLAQLARRLRRRDDVKWVRCLPWSPQLLLRGVCVSSGGALRSYQRASGRCAPKSRQSCGSAGRRRCCATWISYTSCCTPTAWTGASARQPHTDATGRQCTRCALTVTHACALGAGCGSTWDAWRSSPTSSSSFTSRCGCRTWRRAAQRPRACAEATRSAGVLHRRSLHASGHSQSVRESVNQSFGRLIHRPGAWRLHIAPLGLGYRSASLPRVVSVL